MTFAQTLPYLPMVSQVDSPAPKSCYWLSQWCFFPKQCFDGAKRDTIFTFMRKSSYKWLLLIAIVNIIAQKKWHTSALREHTGTMTNVEIIHHLCVFLIQLSWGKLWSGTIFGWLHTNTADRRARRVNSACLTFFSRGGNLHRSANAIASVSYFIITRGDKWGTRASQIFQQASRYRLRWEIR